MTAARFDDKVKGKSQINQKMKTWTKNQIIEALKDKTKKVFIDNINILLNDDGENLDYFVPDNHKNVLVQTNRKVSGLKNVELIAVKIYELIEPRDS